MNRRILISTNNYWSMWNFRKELILRLITEGFEIYAAAKYDGYESELAALGIKTFDVNVAGFNTSIVKELTSILAYCFIFYRVKPKFYFSFTIRPNIYGAIVSRLFGVKSFINVAGVGDAFNRTGIKYFITRRIYSIALSVASHVFFQNIRDMQLLKDNIKENKFSLLPGSGVDLQKFQFKQLESSTSLKLLYMGRFLRDKGLAELIECVNELGREGRAVKLKIVGFSEENDNRYFQRHELLDLIECSAIEVHPRTDDPRLYYYWSDVVVLPTYYNEGTPRSLLEASACGRVLIATKIAGCDRIVRTAENGLLVDIRSARSLYDAVVKVLNLSEEHLLSYGRKSREIVEKEFSVELVCDSYLEIMRKHGDDQCHF